MFIIKLERIEGNIRNIENPNILKPIRIYLKDFEKDNKTDKIKILLNKVYNKYMSCKISSIKTSLLKNELNENVIVNINNENSIFKREELLYKLEDFTISENEEIYFFELQALIFRITNINIERYVTFKVKRTWKEEQGIVNNKALNLYNLMLQKMLINNFNLEVEIYKEKNKNYFLIKKIL